MKLELISFALCPFVHRATTLLHEKGVAFETRYVDLKEKPQWFLSISPRGKVPVLMADGTPLFESSVINEFLDETHPPRLLPEGAIERARQRGWVEMANDLFEAQLKVLWAGTKEDFEAARPRLDAVLSRFEDGLRGPFFAGETFGLVDAAAAPAFYRAAIIEKRSRQRLAAALPKVDAWAQRLAGRESVRKGVLPEFESMLVKASREKGGYFVREWMAAA